MKRVVLFVVFFIFTLVNYFKFNEKLLLNNNINKKIDGMWFVHSKSFLDGKHCQTFNITNQDFKFILEDNFKIKNNYYCFNYEIKPLNNNLFLIGDKPSNIINSSPDYILLNMDNNKYLLTNMEKIEDEYELIYLKLYCALNGIIYNNMWQIHQDKC